MKISRSRKIVLITSGQPSLNPRLVKEADCLYDAGYEVTVIYQYWNEWGSKFDEELLKGKRWEAIMEGGDPQKKISIYFFTRLVHKIALAVCKVIGVKSLLAELALGRCTFLLTKRAKKHPADLYIAHNLPALPAAVMAAKLNKSKCGFDAEDFHRNEMENNTADINVKLTAHIENKYFPLVNYLSTSSPFISKKYKELFPILLPYTILNVFPKAENITITKHEEKPLLLFWFSQTIGEGRGISEVITALGICKKPFELHMLGNFDDQIIQKFHSLAKINSIDTKNLFFYKPIPSDDILGFARNFDIGLASETGYPYNREICLTNKIFTYIQSGLAVLASDTVAQDWLMKQYSGTGILYKKNDSDSLAAALDHYYMNRKELIETRQLNFALGQTLLNWDTEKKIFLDLVHKTLSG